MQTGLYDEIVNLLLIREMAKLTPGSVSLAPLDVADSHAYLSQYVYRLLARDLSQVRPAPGLRHDAERNNSRIQRQIDICNEIIRVLQDAGFGTFSGATISSEAKRLLAVLESALRIAEPPLRPNTPLAFGAILTGTRQDPSLVSELEKEIESADRLDILCSFIKWSGIRVFESALRAFTARPSACLRIITTSYMGATDLKAIRFLATLPNTEIKVSYDTHRTRLHAKAYLVHRYTGFSAAYVGSANISQAALTDGLEWNVKISQYEQPYQWEKIAATFETYWNDGEFEAYRSEADDERLAIALADERHISESDEFVLPTFNLRPYGFQQEILDRISAERHLQGRRKHLIVAATGTGKTMIAAFDFREWRQWWRQSAGGGEPRILFVAHREEILRQSLYTYRAVLRDQNFGGLMVGGNRPGQVDQLFVSIQTYNSQNLTKALSSRHYDYVVIDEFHHAAAPSYRDLLTHIQPASLLGLTATPERTDGLDIRHVFDDHVTAEIRLPDAIGRKLLCPFQYFGITDSVDYSGLRWQRGGYVQHDLDEILTDNDLRAQLIIEKTRSTALDVRRGCGLGFCVSQSHAEYMARKFDEAGIPSTFLTAESPRDHRNRVQKQLRDREINFIFVVDLYNEGIDIPEIDIVLFLRPTESLTVFLQQLGRGLRIAERKDCLTVLDFVGRTHKNYRFDLRLGALLTDRRHRLIEELQKGFPHLPAGCHIQFEKIAREYVLENIRQSLVQSTPRIIENIAGFMADTGLPLTLSAFVDYYRLELDDVYRRGSWARLCVRAGLRAAFSEPDEDKLTKGLRRLHHINAPRLIERLLAILRVPETGTCDFSRLDERRLLMFICTLWGTRDTPSTIESSLATLDRNPTLRTELIELLELRRETIASVPPSEELPFECPLEIHAEYTRDEILAGLGYWKLDRRPAMREGVLHLPDIEADAFFVTLNKTQKHYSPTTMYEDYAISETLFHWQSQSTTSADSPTGRRYINHQDNGYTILLFVRENRLNENRLAEPYHFLGTAEYVSHTGSKPISITWRLHYPMPAHLVRSTTRLVVA